MHLFLKVVLLGLFIVHSHSFALQGKWSLSNQQDIDLDPSIEVEFEFTATLSNDNTISRSLEVSACYNLAYRYEVKDNAIYIEFLNIISIPRECVGREISTIRSKIDTIFYFTINNDKLSLYDPSGFAPFVFERVVPTGNAINGVWRTISIFGENDFTTIDVNGTHAFMCDGQGIALYNITSYNQIIFTILRSRGCDETGFELLKALDSAVFYRIRDNQHLYLLDFGLNQVVRGYQIGFRSFFGPLQRQSPPPQRPPQRPQVTEPTQVTPQPQPQIVPDPITTAPPVIPQPITTQPESIPSPITAPEEAVPNPITSPPEAIPTPPSTPAESIPSFDPNTVPEPAVPQTQPLLIIVNEPPTTQTPQPITTEPVTEPATLPTVEPISIQIAVEPPTQVVIQPTEPATSLTISEAPGEPISVSEPITVFTEPISAEMPTEPETIVQLPSVVEPANDGPSSVQELKPIESLDVLNGKWFIGELKGQSDLEPFKNYYFIGNGGTKRFIMYGGCNVNFATFTLDGNSVDFGTPTSTLRACPENFDSRVTEPFFSQSKYMEASEDKVDFYDENLIKTICLTKERL